MNPTTTTVSVEELIASWPQGPREAVQSTIETYGQPSEYSASQVIWHDNKPWKRTIISREEVPHDFPSPHKDCLEQFIEYQVPPDKFDELAHYDGSVIVERTKGLMSARCAGESMNFVAINLAHQIITDAMTIEQARARYVELSNAHKDGEHPPETTRFTFNLPTGNTKDPDRAAPGAK